MRQRGAGFRRATMPDENLAIHQSSANRIGLAIIRQTGDGNRHTLIICAYGRAGCRHLCFRADFDSGGVNRAQRVTV
jgi:hypothetical protein